MTDSTNKPAEPNTLTYVGLKEFFTNWIQGIESFLEERDKRYAERDRRYEERTRITEESVSSRFRAAEVAVAAALAAQEKAVAAAFLASEKAIVKAEAAQSDYNARSNEFRGQLDDQAKTLMGRNEALAKFNAYDTKFDDLKKFYDSKVDDLKKEIQSLRESRSAGEGAGGARQADRVQSNWSIGVGIAIFGVIIGIVEFVLRTTGH